MKSEENIKRPEDDLVRSIRSIRRIFSVAEYLRRLPPKQLFDFLLAAIVLTCGWLAKALFDRALASHQYYEFSITIAVGFVAFLLLLRRLPRHGPKQSGAISVPLKGLSPYTENDGEMFEKLGRGHLVESCLALLRDWNTAAVAIYGVSGSGKTSLLRAGIQYKLQRNQANFCVYWSAVETNPALALARVIERSTGISCSGDLMSLLKSAPGHLVIIIDQFERLHRHDIRHKPIFDFIQQVSNQPAPHGLQLVITFNLNYYIEWVDFQNEANVPGEKIPVGRFPTARAADIMRTILSAARIPVDQAVIDRYINEIADDGQVSPVGIALGALAFSQWSEAAPDGRVPLQDYARGGVMAVLSAHVRQRFDAPFIRQQDRQPLLRALLTMLIDKQTERLNPLGASVNEIAEAATLRVDRTRAYLKDLADNRILEVFLETGAYVLAHERLVPVLKELDQDIARFDQSIVDQYLSWKREEHKKYLLRGRKLDWVLANIRSFVTGTDAMDRANFLNRSASARTRRYLSASALSAVLIIAGFTISHFLSISMLRKELADSHLAPDLYDRQSQLDSLTIDQTTLNDLAWLHSTSLTEFKIAAPKLISLRGLDSVTQLQSLDIDLESVPLGSLRELSSLTKLHSLTIRHIGRARQQLALDLSGLQELKTLYLDFEGSKIASLPDLEPLRALESLTLNLRSTSIPEIPDLSGLPQLHSVVVFLDGSAVHSLNALAKLAHLDTLAVSLSKDQFQYLADLNNSKALFSLKLYVGSAPLTGLPDLSAIHGLRGLTLQVAGSVAEQLPDITRITQLQNLEITLTGSDMRALPDLGHLTDLRSLDLDLGSSGVQKLPDFSKLQGLERLMLDLSSTGIRDLPDFGYAGGLKELSLLLRQSRVRSLHGIENLIRLRSLTLALSGSQINDISSIARIGSLEKLVLYLRWSQMADLPNLGQLPRLHVLELHLEGDWGIQELPDFSALQGLTELDLFLEGSDIIGLPDLSHLSQLRKITLDFAKSGIQDLSRLKQVNSLEELSLYLQDSGIEVLPDLSQLKNLRTVTADIRRSRIKNLGQMRNLAALQELTINQVFFSLKDLVGTVKKLHIGP